jgi:hypothetical protein
MIGAVRDKIATLDSVPTAWPNKKFTPPAKAPWCEVFYMPAGRDAVTMGAGGEDEVTGIIQVNYNNLLDTGDTPTDEFLGELEDHFVGGRVFSYQQQKVSIIKSVRSPGRVKENNWTTSLSIYFLARIHRPTIN